MEFLARCAFAAGEALHRDDRDPIAPGIGAGCEQAAFVGPTRLIDSRRIELEAKEDS